MQKNNHTNAYRFLQLGIIGCMCAALFFSVPLDADFGWSDAGHHAFDAIFYQDLIRDLGFLSPVQYAMDYYQHYPAITPVMYPPFFSVAQIPGYILIGPFPWVARLTTILFLGLGAFGMLRLTDVLFRGKWSLSVGMIYIAMPVVLFWSRDVMLEPAAMALVIWSFFGFFQYLQYNRTRDIALCLVFATLAPYTKQNTIFIFPAFVLTAILAGKFKMLFDRRFLAGIIISALCGIPLVYVTLAYGNLNLNQSFGGLMPERGVWGHIFYYFKILPQSISVLFLIFSILGLIAAAAMHGRKIFTEYRTQTALLASWALICYLQMTLIQIKEPRHGFFWLPIFAIPAAWLLYRMLALIISDRYRQAIALLIVLSVFVINVHASPMNWSEGFRKPAEYVTGNWEGSALLTSIIGDAPLIFHIRTLDPERRYRVYRSVKVFESMMVYSEWRQETFLDTPEEFLDSLRRWGIRYILIENEMPEMSPADTVMRSALAKPDFQKIADFPVRYYYARDAVLSLYRYNGEISLPGKIPEIHLPIVETVIPGDSVKN